MGDRCIKWDREGTVRAAFEFGCQGNFISQVRGCTRLESIRKGLSHPERSKVLHLDLADKAIVGNAAAKLKSCLEE